MQTVLRMMVVLLAAFSIPAAAGEVYKWVDENGKVQYGDVPTNRTGEPDKIRTDQCKGAACQKNEEEAYFAARQHHLNNLKAANKWDEDNRMQILANQGEIAIRMPKNLVIQAWGNPALVNVTEGRADISEQWVYERQSKRMYVYFGADGLVRTIQR